MWSSAAAMSLKTLATFPVYIHSSKMEVTPSGWLRPAEFISPQDTVLDKVREGVFSHRCDSYSSGTLSEKKRWM